MNAYYFAPEFPTRADRPRFHAKKQCLFAAKLLGMELKRQEVDTGQWYNTCTCHACGLPLSQSPMEDKNVEVHTL